MLSATPLTGIRVVELGQNLAAPSAAAILADMGATVIKVESISGDDARHYGAPVGENSSIVFEAFNRNKEGVSLDLSQESERAWLRDFIVANADVCIQSFRPGKTAEMGLGAAALTVLAPRLIYCNLGAYGGAGPLSDLPGYDPMMQAFSGIMSVTGDPESSPARVGVPLVDLGTGLWLCVGVLAALRERERTGTGGVVDVSLFETALSWMTLHFASFAASGKIPHRAGSGLRGVAPNRAYHTASGELMISALNNKLFFALADVLGHPEWRDDVEFATAHARGRHQHRVNHAVQEVLLTRPRDEWVAQLTAAGVPCSPIQDVAEVLAHPQTHATGMVATIAGAIPAILPALRFDGERPGLRTPAPRLGEHNDKYRGGKSRNEKGE
ncbi:MAG: CaiB/BaiF CoA transferase family protein [Porticoccaceae bacterium]